MLLDMLHLTIVAKTTNLVALTTIFTHLCLCRQQKLLDLIGNVAKQNKH